MGRSHIEWLRNTDGSQGYSLNPLKGLCPMACKDDRGKDYCYARKIYKRFRWNPEIRFDVRPLWDIEKIQKPSRIFVGSTMELFGEWVNDCWLETIFRYIRDNPQHTFILLTKQPQNLAKWSPFPPNCWVGVSATDARTLDSAVRHLYELKATVRFVSLEPFLSWNPLFPDIALPGHLNWLIIGSRTQPTRHPRKEWVREIIAAADKARIPVFVKEPLASYMNIQRQEFPK